MPNELSSEDVEARTGHSDVPQDVAVYTVLSFHQSTLWDGMCLNHGDFTEVLLSLHSILDRLQSDTWKSNGDCLSSKTG